MIGSLGTVVTFWLCGALERKTVIEKVSPELKDATIQAEYTQATSGGTSEQSSDFVFLSFVHWNCWAVLSSRSPLSLLSRLGQCEERTYNLWNLPYFIFDFWDWARDFCFWTRTEVSFDPILSYFQESTGDWICKVHCMLYNGTFYTGFIRRFSTSPEKNCFVNFFYCRYVRGLDFLDWNGTPWLSGLHCIALITLRFGRRLHTDLSSKGGVKILPGIALRDQWRCTVLISPSLVCGRAYFDVEWLWMDRS